MAKEKKYSDALRLCLEARKTCPENLRTWMLLSDVYRVMGDLKECKEILILVLDYAIDDTVVSGTPWKQLEPVKYVSHFAYVLGTLYSRDKDYTKAQKYLHIAQKNNLEGNPNIALTYAQNLHNQRDYKKSIFILEKLIKIHPDFVPGLYLLGQNHLILLVDG